MANSMTEQVSRRMMMANPGQGVQQQVHKDIGDDRYRDLRRARKLRFFVNGDRYFRGKKLYVTPNRYYNFNDLLNDLTGKLPSNLNLPYGVRQIFTPVGGRRIFDIEDLADGETYVCAGFEGFKTIKYGKAELEPWSMARPQQNAQQETDSDYYGGSYRYRGYANNAFHPGRYFRTNHSYQQRRWPGTFGNNNAAAQRAAYPINQSDNIPHKPKVVTIVRNGTKPRQNVKILLNRRSVQSYEQLLSDISEAFGPKYRQNKVRKLFTVRGREVHGISDFFRDDECFIALGVGEPALVDTEVAEMLEELFPEGNVSKSLLKEWERNQRRRKRGVSPTGASVKSHANQNNQMNNLNASHPADKRDSGFDSSDASTNRSETEHTGPPGYRKAMNQRRKIARDLERERAERDKENQSETGSTSPAQHGYYLMRKLEKERLKVAAEEKERAKRRQQKMADAEKRVTEEEKRKRGQVPMKNINDPFKKADDAKEKEKDEAKRRKEEERRRKEEERIEMERRQKEKEKEERDAAEKAARERMALAEREEKEKNEKERVEREKQEKLDREKKEKEKIEKKKAEKEEARRQHKGDKLPALNKDKDKEKQGKSLGTHKQTDGINSGAVEPDNNNNDTNSEPIPQPQQQHEPETHGENNNKDSINKQQQKEKRRQEKEKEQQLKEQQQKQQQQQQEQPRKRAKTKIVRRTKAERQVANDDVILQKYDLGRKLGDGNFAIVRQSRKKETGQEYAIKVIDKAKLKGKEHMVENEIDIMKDCSHHNIVRLYEEFETTDKLYLVMELVKGGDLFDAITQSVKFGEMDSSLMVRDLGNALFYLHSRSIVHRDLKPENLLVHRNKDGSITLKLADFGLAMEVKELIYTVCGTPTYVAPEILTEIGYGLEVDMWAVGVITYILLCGFPPFRSPDRNQTELFEYIKAGEYEFLSPYWDNTSKDAKNLIQHLLVVDRKKRYTPVDVLSHRWVVCCGDTDRKPEGAHSIEQACKETRKELEAQAKLNYESYQRLKEKKRREREKGLIDD